MKIKNSRLFSITKLSKSEASTSYTPLHEAAIAGEDATVEVLLIAGADRFAKDPKVEYGQLTRSRKFTYIIYSTNLAW